MRIVIFSNAPWCGSGYGTQADLVARKLIAEGHDAAVAAFFGLQGTPMNWNGVEVLPGSAEDAWGQDVMLGHFQQHKADLMISLMDFWVLDAYKLRDQAEMGLRLAPMIPSDTEPLSLLDWRNLKATGLRPIAISQHGMRNLAEFDPVYIPHSIDTSVFTPRDEDAVAESRERAGFTGKFLIGMNAANQDPVRKGFGEQLAAFRLFINRHPEADAKMLIHTRKSTRSGINFDRMVEVLALQEHVQFGDQYLTVTGMTTQSEIARWYSTLDILSNASYGEGFGLPIIEAQACGTPVIVTDATAMTELCGGGWLVSGEFYWNAGHSSWWTRPSIQTILAAYEKAWEETQSGEIEERRKAAREFALNYDINKVYEDHWVPALKELGETIASGIAVSDGLRWKITAPADRMGPWHEDGVSEKIEGLLPEGGVFLDVGAHVGHYTLRLAKKASGVIAVEANPPTQERLLENLILNGITNVSVLKVAAWDEETTFRVESQNALDRDGSSRIFQEEGGEVRGVPLDTMLSEIESIDLVKLDVEGADLHALRGMRETLARCRPVMVVEDHSIYKYYKREDLDALLDELGYDIGVLGEYGRANYILATPKEAGDAAD